MSNETEPRFVRQMTFGRFSTGLFFRTRKPCLDVSVFARPLARFGVSAALAAFNESTFYRQQGAPMALAVAKKCGKDKPLGPIASRLKTGTIFEENQKRPPAHVVSSPALDADQQERPSAHFQIHRMLGTGSYQTAWYMCMRFAAPWHGKDPEFKQI